MSFHGSNLTAWETFREWLNDELSSGETDTESPAWITWAAGGGGASFLLLLIGLAIAIHKNLIQCERGIHAVTGLINAIASLVRGRRNDSLPTPPPRDFRSAYPGVLTDDELIRMRALHVATAAREQPLYTVVSRSEYV